MDKNSDSSKSPAMSSRKRWLVGWLLLAISVIVVLIVIANIVDRNMRYGAGAGPTGINSPSRSESSAKELGVFLKPVTFTYETAGNDFQDIEVVEAWVEEVVKRDESGRYRIRPIGERLCVRLKRHPVFENPEYENPEYGNPEYGNPEYRVGKRLVRSIEVAPGELALDTGLTSTNKLFVCYTYENWENKTIPDHGTIVFKLMDGETELSTAKIHFVVDSIAN